MTDRYRKETVYDTHSHMWWRQISIYYMTIPSFLWATWSGISISTFFSWTYICPVYRAWTSLPRSENVKCGRKLSFWPQATILQSKHFHCKRPIIFSNRLITAGFTWRWNALCKITGPIYRSRQRVYRQPEGHPHYQTRSPGSNGPYHPRCPAEIPKNTGSLFQVYV